MAFEPKRSIAGIMTAHSGRRYESPLAAGVRGYFAGQELKRRDEQLKLERNREITEQIGRKATAIKMMDPQDRPYAWAEFRNNAITTFGKDPGDYSEAALDDIVAESQQGLAYLEKQGTYGKPFEAINKAGERVFVESTPGGQRREIEGYTVPPDSANLTANQKEYAHWQNLVQLYGRNDPRVQMFEAQMVAPKWLNLGPEFRGVGATGQPIATYEISPSPEQDPEFLRQQAAAKKGGATEGQMQAEYDEMVARLPRLETLVQELSALGKVATFTVAGQAAESVMRQMGMEPGPSAVARTEYISKVDNEILPLLRQTFGAQFTENEGRSLKATLGDPDKTPDEKDAVLRSFIATKRAEVETRRRILEQMQQRGQPQPAATPGTAPAAPPAPEYTTYGPRANPPGAVPGMELIRIRPE